ncbi:hypothetical protein TSMEX_000441 [Taenia solium]|eukprot:TsM_001191400 transcript=TsM_001191400 gene=TsM_001191400
MAPRVHHINPPDATLHRSVKEASKDPSTDSNLKELKEELERIVKRHEVSTTQVEEVKAKLSEELTNAEPPEALSSDKLDASREELLWRSIFGKDSKNAVLNSATSQYLPSLAPAETDVSKKKQVTMEMVGDPPTNLHQATGLTVTKSVRQQNSVWSALEDLEKEKL